MRPSDDRQCSTPAEQLGQDISQGARLCVARDEDDVCVVGYQAFGSVLAEVGGIGNIVSKLAAPNRYDLRHDADELFPEVAGVQRTDRAADRAVAEQIEYGDLHAAPPVVNAE